VLLAAARGRANRRPAHRHRRRRRLCPRHDISLLAFGVRDDYTSLMWLGATGALWQLGDPKAQRSFSGAMPMPRARR
jgi:hypothetical protein